MLQSTVVLLPSHRNPVRLIFIRRTAKRPDSEERRTRENCSQLGYPNSALRAMTRGMRCGKTSRVNVELDPVSRGKHTGIEAPRAFRPNAPETSRPFALSSREFTKATQGGGIEHCCVSWNYSYISEDLLDFSARVIEAYHGV
jgi:hypothetical protein